MYSKNAVAPVPPMGWNSYDYYNTMVNERQVRANADYMAKNLLPHGWEYVVIDIQWSDPDAGSLNRAGVQYIPFSRFCLDEWSRQIPAPNRFPSSSGGNGFAPLASYVHSLGLKFGLHIMRGIPRHAAHDHLPVRTHDGSKVTAAEIADPYSVSRWNPDMYGTDPSNRYSQDYWDSVFELYAGWGVDFVKVDDICNTNMYPSNPYSAAREIEMIALAIERCGRPMVLSLSPGPAVIEKAWHLKKYANMWRITDDFWDDWPLLKAMFGRCAVWQGQSESGCWPDCDMLPLNVLSWGWGNGARKSRLTADETRTMISLWCVFRSPLMIGTDLPRLDKRTLALITNDEILSMDKNPCSAELVRSGESEAVWKSPAPGGGCFAALFNTGDRAQELLVPASEIFGSEKSVSSVRDLWARRDVTGRAVKGGLLSSGRLRAHSCAVYLVR